MTKKRFLQAIIDTLPLGVSVTPWGILFGSLAIQSGLSMWQSQLVSLIVFAGAAQMSGVAIMAAGGSLASLLNTTFMISSRHLLYSAIYKDDIRDLPFVKRIVFAFFLTDEMFAIAHADRERTGRFDYAYALASGIAFYVMWNLATFVGIIAATSVDGIENLGLDFAIAATFIAMTVPRMKGFAMIFAAVVSGVCAVILELLHINNSLVIAGLLGMIVGYLLTERGLVGRRKWKS